jgi:hypothetical protein
MRNYLQSLLMIMVVLVVRCSPGERQKSPFTVSESAQTMVLMENSDTVFIYRRMPKSLTGEYICNDYIQPLYDLQGNVLTEEFPADHPYHRGVFWAWHQLYAGSRSLGDGWTNDSISQEVMSSSIETDRSKATLITNVNWKSDVLGNDTPFMNEKEFVTVHKKADGVRIIDFEIRLKALVRNLKLGGSADKKGYGGFCIRLRLPDSLVFTSVDGPVVPQELQIKAGPWMDFSGKFGNGDEITGLAILCPPNMPDYPEPWILRQKGSMQNVVFPGSERIRVPRESPLVLRYRVIIHNGNAGSIDLRRFQQEYAMIYND